MVVKLTPPSALTCHWTVGVGLPLAEAVNDTELPAHTVLLVGLAVTNGAALTVTVALPEGIPVQLTSETVLTV